MAKFVLLSEIMVWGSPKQHDVLPKKLDNLLISDFGEWHHFDLFGEVVGGFQQKPQLRLRSGEWTNHVQPPLHEEPRTSQSVEVGTRSI